MKFYHLCRLISDDFRLKVPKIAKNGTLVSYYVHKDGYTFNKYNNTVFKIIQYVELLLFEEKSEICREIIRK